MMRSMIFLLSALVTGNLLHAQNPVIQTHYTPDPAPMVYKDSVYVYTGDDIPGHGFYYMTKWRVFSSADMVNWTDHGAPISLESFSWGVDRAWAAQCIRRNGKFYWYVCMQTDKNNMAIGVAVSDGPTGPFRDAIGKPLITTNSWSNIDPTVFIDDNGQAYLYWGNGQLYYVKLNSDMISYTGNINEVPLSVASFGGVRRAPNRDSSQNRQAEQNKDMFVEGPWFYKRNGHYYQMFAGMENGTECLSYSMSTSPEGPWTYQGKIMTKQPTNSFTNHGGIIDFKGRSYLFYHTGLLKGGGSFGRSTAIESFRYNDDGTIPAITISATGPEAVGSIDPYRSVEAETIAWAENCTTGQDTRTGVFVTGIRSKGWIKVRAVDFGKSAPKKFSADLAAGLSGGILEVFADSIGGVKLTTIQITRTGGWDKWKTFTAPVLTPLTGIHDLYFSFNGRNLVAGRELFNFDRWKFEK
ncbi:glycoside hydrolase family 43 protein [Pseudoflavitalea rhizosphaerae]|uniref:glycoside hydrolase family 43 protein n=1 Tax=Pseudoflavitalea rhizosphaerae TaxID=1884793 RepID=UPI0019D1F795|nr:glycoside hydrolase family 43 protein [Pseudoflavitalea rhizosphaerae]